MYREREIMYQLYRYPFSSLNEIFNKLGVRAWRPYYEAVSPHYPILKE